MHLDKDFTEFSDKDIQHFNDILNDKGYVLIKNIIKINDNYVSNIILSKSPKKI